MNPPTTVVFPTCILERPSYTPLFDLLDTKPSEEKLGRGFYLLTSAMKEDHLDILEWFEEVALSKKADRRFWFSNKRLVALFAYETGAAGKERAVEWFMNLPDLYRGAKGDLLMGLAKNGNLPLVEHLLKTMDLKCQGFRIWHSWNKAIANNHLDIARLLEVSDGDLSNHEVDSSTFNKPIKNSWYEACEYIVQMDRKAPEILLIKAAKYNNLLLFQHFYPRYKDTTKSDTKEAIWQFAFINKNAEFQKFLLSEGCEYDIDDLISVFIDGRLDVVQGFCDFWEESYHEKVYTKAINRARRRMILMGKDDDGLLEIIDWILGLHVFKSIGEPIEDTWDTVMFYGWKEMAKILIKHRYFPPKDSPQWITSLE